MTKLQRAAKVAREVDTGRFGDVIVTMREEGLYLRQKGRRTQYGPLSWAGLYVQAAEKTARATVKKPRRAARTKLGVGL